MALASNINEQMPDRGDSAQLDRLLIERIRRREPQALIDAYALYGKRVFSLILRIVHDRQSAEEVLQDTFMRLWTRYEFYDAEKGALLSWLFRVARNGALDFLRKESRRGDFDVVFIEGDPELEDLHEEVLSVETAFAVRDALSALPNAQKRLIELAYFEGLTHSELAEQTGESLGTVKSRIRLGLKKLRDVLGNLNKVNLR
jgi:RNA polymerase sigma-70 factor, ECF subfamily